MALLSRDDEHHGWIDAHLDSLPWPWLTCDAALSETLYHQPRWRGDGKEIFFVSDDQEMFAAPITASGGVIQAGDPVRLFRHKSK